MTEAAGLRANAEEELPPAKMTVEQALGQERIRAELRRALTMVWSAFAAIGAGFALLFPARLEKSETGNLAHHRALAGVFRLVRRAGSA